jgi:basic membrane protein A
VKKLDNAVYQTIADHLDGAFTPGTVIYGLAEDGVDLAPFHEADPAIPAQAKAAVEAARLGLIDGTINPYWPCVIDPNSIGLVTDNPNLMDGGFNEMSYAGLLRAQTVLGVTGTVYISTDHTGISNNLNQCAMDGNALCISVGWLTFEAISNTAPLFPDTHFAILDFTFESYPNNLRGITFASQEAGYLAGTLAGYMTESDILGIIGGMPIPQVDSFIDGYAQGATCANPNVTTIISYTNTFADPDLGAQYAQSMLDQEADVIFAPAGPTGNGAILAATQSSAWAVGVDVDEYLTTFMSGTIDGSEYLLTSAVKKLDNAVYQTIADQVDDLFSSGTVNYSLVSNGVGLAPFHEADAAIPADAKDAIEEARLGLIDGSIDPYGPCPVTEYKVYLPLGSKNFPP